MAAVVLAGAATTVACGGGESPATPTPGGSSAAGTSGVNLGTPAHIVSTTAQWEFDPKTLRATVGDIVEWTNTSTVAHTITFDATPALTDPLIRPNDTWEVKFLQPGTYAYRCTIHPFMTGTVVVS